MNPLRSDAGFTLPELIVAMALGMLVVLGAFTLMDTTLSQTRNVQERVDAAQRGRVTMDTVTRSLRSQVCASTATERRTGLVSGDASSITIYRDLSDGRDAAVRAPDRVTLSLVGGVLTEQTFRPTGTVGAPVYPTTPTTQRQLATDIAPAVENGQPQPLFRYFAYDDEPVARPLAPVAPTATDEAARVARIEVRFVARPTRSSTDKNALSLHDDVFVRGTDPHDEDPAPRCG
jgi:prepilin-type N-terminal cleavage/methylation domain-containing protein